jgi:general secretion pathway protein G
MMKAKRGFTLVEILIVVVILGILAAIVIPQFTGASTEAKLSSLVSDLQTLRSQVELYKLQHNEALPGVVGSATFEEAMTGETEVDGDVWAAGDSYGPYMQKLPRNQFNDLSTVRQEATDKDSTTAGANTAGWVLCTLDGSIFPDFIDMNGDTASDGTETDY